MATAAATMAITDTVVITVITVMDIMVATASV